MIIVGVITVYRFNDYKATVLFIYSDLQITLT